MGLFILESSDFAPLDVPGTAHLEDINKVGVALDGPCVKHAPGREDLILVPTPSDDAEDPLNWSSWKKELFFITVCLGTTLAGVVGPIVAPAFVALIQDLNEPLNKIVQVNGSLVFTIGFGSIFFATFQTKYGSRPAFLIAALLLFVASVWASASKNYGSLIGARSITGLAMGCYFSNVPGSINNIYFVHQRGTRLALWNLSLIGGINIGPVISAQIIQAKNWHIAYWIFAAICGLSFLLTIVFCPETAYDRTDYYDSLRNKSVVKSQLGDEEKDVAQSSVRSPSDETPKGSPYRIFSGSKSPESFLKILSRPFYYITCPPVIFGTLVFSVTFNLLPLLASAYAQIFSAPPYNFSTSAIGLVSGIPPLIGTMIGTFTSGPLSDWFVKAMSKRNQGIFEPEMRLVLILGFLVFGGMGLFGWGLSAAAGDPWIAQAIFIAILHVGVSAGTIGCIGYITEVTREDAGDAVGLAVLIKSCIGFGEIFFVTDWYASQGSEKFFNALGYLTIAVSLLAIPMWIFGKRTRAWSYKHKFLKA